MCGIIGYVGRRPCKELLLTGLQRLEYLGYDSAGLALREDDGLDYVRAVGNLQNLIAAAGSNVYIAYTDANNGSVRLLVSHNRGGSWSSIERGIRTARANARKPSSLLPTVPRLCRSPHSLRQASRANNLATDMRGL